MDLNCEFFTFLVQCYTNMTTLTFCIIVQLMWNNISFILLVHQLLNKNGTNTIMYILFIHNYRVNNHFLSEIHVFCSSVEVKTLRMSFMPFLSWNKYWHLPFFHSLLEDIGFFKLRSPEFTKMQLEHYNTLKLCYQSYWHIPRTSHFIVAKYHNDDNSLRGHLWLEDKVDGCG